MICECFLTQGAGLDTAVPALQRLKALSSGNQQASNQAVDQIYQAVLSRSANNTDAADVVMIRIAQSLQEIEAEYKPPRPRFLPAETASMPPAALPPWLKPGPDTPLQHGHSMAAPPQQELGLPANASGFAAPWNDKGAHRADERGLGRGSSTGFHVDGTGFGRGDGKGFGNGGYGRGGDKGFDDRAFGRSDGKAQSSERMILPGRQFSPPKGSTPLPHGGERGFDDRRPGRGRDKGLDDRAFGVYDDETNGMLDEWVQAKRAKDFVTSDRIREALRARNVDPETVRERGRDRGSGRSGDKGLGTEDRGFGRGDGKGFDDRGFGRGGKGFDGRGRGGDKGFEERGLNRGDGKGFNPDDKGFGRGDGKGSDDRGLSAQAALATGQGAARPPSYPCKNFAAGHCRYGAKCHFIHSTDGAGSEKGFGRGAEKGFDNRGFGDKGAKGFGRGGDKGLDGKGVGKGDKGRGGGKFHGEHKGLGRGGGQFNPDVFLEEMFRGFKRPNDDRDDHNGGPPSKIPRV